MKPRFWLLWCSVDGCLRRASYRYGPVSPDEGGPFYCWWHTRQLRRDLRRREALESL